MKRTTMIFAMTAAAAVLLTGCGGSSVVAENSQTDATTENTAADTTTTSSAESVAEAGTTVSAEQTSAITSSQTEKTTVSTTASTETTQPVYTEPQQNSDGTYDLRKIFTPNSTNPLNCTGTVHAKGGLNLRKSPSKDAQRITLLKDGTKLKITGFTVTENVYYWDSRWYQVEYNGQTGYVSSEFVTAVCTTPAERLSVLERATLCAAMYYQAQNVHGDLCRGASMLGASYSDEFDDSGYTRLKPDGLTIAKLREEFHKYFAKSYADDFDEYYYEKDNALWCMTGYGDNVAIEYIEPSMLTEQKDKELSCTMTLHYNTYVYQPEDGSTTDDEAFVLVYEEGAWKVYAYTPQY